MKKLAFYALVTALLTACGPRSTISGYIEGLTNDTIILKTITLSDYKTHTDTLVAKDGKITFNAPNDEPAAYTFMPAQGTHKFEGGTRRFNSCSDINLFRIDGEKVTFKARMDSIFVTEFSVRGSQINEDWNEIHSHINPLITKAALLQFEDISYEDFEREHTKINNEIIAYNQEYIRQHPDRLISANLIAGTGSTENMIKYADMISNEEFSLKRALKTNEEKERKGKKDGEGTQKQEPPRFREGSPERRRRPTLPHCGAVPSARPGLTSLFGMGRGGTPGLKPPEYDMSGH